MQLANSKRSHTRSDLKIVAMLTYGTDSATSTSNQLPQSPTQLYISNKQGRSTDGGPKYLRAKQIQRLINPRKSGGYIQVPRAYLQPYLQVPTGTSTNTPAGGTQFLYMTTSSYAAPEAAETYIMALSDPCRTRKRTENTHLPRMRAPEANQHTSSNIKWTRIYPLSEPCPQP